MLPLNYSPSGIAPEWLQPLPCGSTCFYIASADLMVAFGEKRRTSEDPKPKAKFPDSGHPNHLILWTLTFEQTCALRQVEPRVRHHRALRPELCL